MQWSCCLFAFVEITRDLGVDLVVVGEHGAEVLVGKLDVDRHVPSEGGDGRCVACEEPLS